MSFYSLAVNTPIAEILAVLICDITILAIIIGICTFFICRTIIKSLRGLRQVIEYEGKTLRKSIEIDASSINREIRDLPRIFFEEEASRNKTKGETK